MFLFDLFWVDQGRSLKAHFTHRETKTQSSHSPGPHYIARERENQNLNPKLVIFDFPIFKTHICEFPLFIRNRIIFFYHQEQTTDPVVNSLNDRRMWCFTFFP